MNKIKLIQYVKIKWLIIYKLMFLLARWHCSLHHLESFNSYCFKIPIGKPSKTLLVESKNTEETV